MPRYVLDFGSLNGGLTPPVFSWFRDASTHAALPAPQILNGGDGTWTYYFDFTFPAATSPNTSSIEYGVVLNGVGLTDVVAQPGYTPTRFFLDFDSANGQRTPPTFTWFRDAVTKAAISPPTVFANTAPAWNYYFDAVFPAGTTAIEYGITLNGVGLTDVISAPAATSGAGGALTLTQIIARIRSQSDTENDPHISDAEITDWFNESRFELYGKLVTSFGDDYYVSKASLTTDGVNTALPLPDGILYGGALPYFKGELLEAIGGIGTASPVTPLTLRKFNLREKNRFSHPFVQVASRGFLPRYRNVGSNIELWPLPIGGIQLQLWYAPKLAPLVNPTDVADDMNGWLSLPIVDCVIKAIEKQERDASSKIARKQGLLLRLDEEIKDRDLGEPNTVQMTDDGDGFGPFGGGVGGAWN